MHATNAQSSLASGFKLPRLMLKSKMFTLQVRIFKTRMLLKVNMSKRPYTQTI